MRSIPCPEGTRTHHSWREVHGPSGGRRHPPRTASGLSRCAWTSHRAPAAWTRTSPPQAAGHR
ncbi:MAG: hypothetical protein ACK56F_29410, partial [bacterium]